jgi:hypothetical protein
MAWIIMVKSRRKNMQITIVETPWKRTLLGLSRIHDPSRTESDEVVELLGSVWEAVRIRQITTTGINYVVYGASGEYFCGLESNSPTLEIPGLIKNQISLDQYVYYKHIGPYSGIHKSYSEIIIEMEKRSLHRIPPSVEIYGHWNIDPTLLETELLLSFI